MLGPVYPGVTCAAGAPVYLHVCGSGEIPCGSYDTGCGSYSFCTAKGSWAGRPPTPNEAAGSTFCGGSYEGPSCGCGSVPDFPWQCCSAAQPSCGGCGSG
ncbi:MAG: hypothetical protein ACYDCL_09050 [Myxococcales bacterium]